MYHVLCEHQQSVCDLACWVTTTFSGKDALANWASLVTIIAFIAAPLKYFRDVNTRETAKHKKEKDDLSRITRNLYGELNDGKEGLDEKIYPNDLKVMKMQGKNDVYFMNRFLNHDIYDSLVNSGQINFLTYELQQEMQNIFNMIKNHNYYLRLTSELQDKEKGVSESSYSYYEILDNYEKILLKSIPDMMDRLKKYFEFDPIKKD